MGEAIWTNVKVKIPTAWLPSDVGLPGALGYLADYLVESYNEPEVDDQGTATTLHFSGESNYGILGVQEWLDELEKLRIPFEASDEPKYEYGGGDRLLRRRALLPLTHGWRR